MTRRAYDLALPVAVPAAAVAILLGYTAGRTRPRPQPDPEDIVVTTAARHETIRRTRVWQPPPVPVAEADLGSNPPGFVDEAQELTCRFLVERSAGMTAKFHCVLPDGRRIKVKYGAANAERATEVAATRLVSALGFGADRMYVLARVRCQGCPVFPYPRFPLLDALRSDPAQVRTFDDVVIELPLEGRAVEEASLSGWGFDELKHVDPSVGGASRAEVDALRLMAVFLQNWDLKYPNQRLVCLAGGEPRSTGDPCTRPLAIMHDLGASFGPWRLDVEAWEKRPLWKDRARCVVSMKDLPFEGASFPDVEISEGGRRLLGGLLAELRPEQVAELFEGAGVTRFRAHRSEASADVSRWVGAFRAQVDQLTSGPACSLQ
jgi:hypothetical protein